MDERCLAHRITQVSLENPMRLQGLYPLIKDRFNGCMQTVPHREAKFEDIERIHSSFYLKQVREHALKNDPYSYDRDTYLMDCSLEAAQLAAGGCLELADRIMNKELDQGFALIRPPGHHAEPGRGMGFCILNNVAITASYLQKKYGVARILIIDFDIHHGNGTQEAFYCSDNVLFVSLHQNNIFPFSGAIREVGNEKGRGYTINIPVYPFFGDGEYVYLMGKLLQSVAEQYMPEIILVSAGFDGHEDDTISSTSLTTGGFGLLTTLLKQAAADYCDKKILFVLEGGYNPLSLEKSVMATLDSLVKNESRRVGILFSERAQALFTDHPLHEFWTM